MSYLVLARKYRPQTFAEIVGQEHVTRTLANAFANWKREYGKCEKLGKSLGAPEAEYAKYRPDLSEYEQMRKAAGVSR